MPHTLHQCSRPKGVTIFRGRGRNGRYLAIIKSTGRSGATARQRLQALSVEQQKPILHAWAKGQPAELKAPPVAEVGRDSAEREAWRAKYRERFPKGRKGKGLKAKRFAVPASVKPTRASRGDYGRAAAK